MTNLKTIRAQHIPEGAILQDAQGSDTEIYFYRDRDERPCARGFYGRQQKPSMRFYFSGEKDREFWLLKIISECKELAEEKRKRAEERKKPHSFGVGDILVSSWGYDQTNVNFFQVVKIVSNRTIEVREISKKITRYETSMSGEAMPCPDNFISGPSRFLVSDESIKIHSFTRAYKWDGREKFWSSYA